MPKAQRTKIFKRRAEHIFMDHCTQELLEAYVPYNEAQFSQLSALDIAFTKFYVGNAHVRRSLCSPDLLFNIKSFPIGCSYGDRDFLGSEGADWIVKSNAYFKTGESQLFRVPNTEHNIVQGNPGALVEMLTAFYYGDVSYVYEEKPRTMWVPPQAHQQGKPKL